MRIDTLAHLPKVPKAQVMREYRNIECSKEQGKEPTRSPTFALRLALSVVGNTPREGFIPLKFFSENDIQIYLGLPFHPLNKLLHFTDATTSRQVVNVIFPYHLEKKLTLENRYRPLDSLPENLKEWIEPVQIILKKMIQGDWDPPPINVLNFTGGKRAPWMIRAEHLCGQVPDGTHRVLAYTLLGSEFPEIAVRIRVLGIHSLALAISNGMTMGIRFLLDPFRAGTFKNKRFGGAANFVPTEKP